MMRGLLFGITTALLCFALFISIKKIHVAKISINYLKKNNTIFNPQSKFKYFYENKPAIKIIEKNDWMTESVEYIHNDDGMNSLRNYKEIKLNGIIRIVALGDSYTYGINTSTKDNWVEKLEYLLNRVPCENKKFEVLNFGVPGYDIEYTTEHYKLRGKKYNPNLIIWFIKNDDFLEPKELTIPLEKNINKTGKYELNLYLQALSKLSSTHNMSEIVEREMKNMFDFISSTKNIKFLLVTPRKEKDYPSMSNNFFIEISKMTKELKLVEIVQIDIENNHLLLPNDFHFNKKGNDFFSQELYKNIRQYYCKR